MLDVHLITAGRDKNHLPTLEQASGKNKKNVCTCAFPRVSGGKKISGCNV